MIWDNGCISGRLGKVELALTPCYSFCENKHADTGMFTIA